jgi:FKBP-type peptidyl-prolyl cis-trans isomerase
MKKLGLVALAALCLVFASCEKKEEKKAEVKVMTEDQMIKEMWPNAIKTASGLMYVVTKEGAGAKPNKGTKVKAHYNGTLINGQKFDSSVDRGQPFEFVVGVHQVIAGWDEAFLDMKKGEKRTLIIPANLGYGDRGASPVIPPKATLVFDVELIDFK